MPLSQHPIDHAQKRARSTNGLCGLGVRKLSACFSLLQPPLSFFHAVSRVPPRNLLKKVKIAGRRRIGLPGSYALPADYHERVSEAVK
jgi:hypothetical protein